MTNKPTKMQDGGFGDIVVFNVALDKEQSDALGVAMLLLNDHGYAIIKRDLLDAKDKTIRDLAGAIELYVYAGNEAATMAGVAISKKALRDNASQIKESGYEGQ